MKGLALTTTVKIFESIKVFQRKGIIKSLVSNKCIRFDKMVQRGKTTILACMETLWDEFAVIKVAWRSRDQSQANRHQEFKKNFWKRTLSVDLAHRYDWIQRDTKSTNTFKWLALKIDHNILQLFVLQNNTKDLKLLSKKEARKTATSLTRAQFLIPTFWCDES